MLERYKEAVSSVPTSGMEQLIRSIQSQIQILNKDLVPRHMNRWLPSHRLLRLSLRLVPHPATQ